MEKLALSGANVFPVMSEMSHSTDTRFGTADDFINTIETICHRPIISSIKDAEPIGPKKMLDLLIIAPCTGNSLAKLASGIADTAITMAAKAHLRNQRPLLLAVSTNDGLANAAKNIGSLLNYKHIYFVPFGQDVVVAYTIQFNFVYRVCANEIFAKVVGAFLIKVILFKQKKAVHSDCRSCQVMPLSHLRLQVLRLSDAPDANDVIKFLRQRKVVHFQRFTEALNRLQDNMKHKPAMGCGISKCD